MKGMKGKLGIWAIFYSKIYSRWGKQQEIERTADGYL